MDFKPYQQRFQWKPLVGLVVLAIIIVILLTLPQQRKERGQEFSPTGVPIPQEIYTYTGILDAKDNNVLSLTAKAVANYLTGDQTMRVKLSRNAEIIRLVIPFDAPIGVPITPEEEKISVNDLPIGEEIRVYSKNNVRGKTSFDAYKVEVVTFK